MTETYEWSLMGGVAVLVLGGFAWFVQQEKKRREAFSRLALRHGFTFQKEDASLSNEGFARLHLFHLGRGKHFKNVLKGPVGGARGIVCDYQYTTGGGRSSHTHDQTVAILTLDGTRLPEFELRPEHLFHKIGSAFGYKDIDFERAPEFSKRYLLRGKDEQAVRALFRPELLQAFARQKDWAVEGAAGWLVVYRQEKRIKPEEFQRFLSEVRELAGRFSGALSRA